MLDKIVSHTDDKTLRECLGTRYDAVTAYVDHLRAMPWLDNHGDEPSGDDIKMYKTRNAARDAALDAALNACVCIICAGLPIGQQHIDHARRRWSVCEAGYGVLCDVDGTLYCYRRV